MSKHSSTKTNAPATPATPCLTAALAAARTHSANTLGTVPPFALALALALAFALAPARPARAQTTNTGTTIGQSTVVWDDNAPRTGVTGTGANDRAWVWDITATNWFAYDPATNAATTGTTFTNHDAVVFGASGTSSGGYIIIDTTYSGSLPPGAADLYGNPLLYYPAYGGPVYISPQPYTGDGATLNGINPGIIIASGAWEFDGGQIYSGTSGTNTVTTSGIAITGNSSLQLDRSGTFSRQNIDIAPGVSFTLSTSPTLTTSMTAGFVNPALTLGFTNNSYTGADATSAITTGPGASLTLSLATPTGTETTATYNFTNNRTRLDTAGAAINAGGNVTITGTNLTAYFVNNQTVDTTATANTYASAIYSTGTLTIADGATLRGEGGFAAQQINITSATIAPVYNESSREQGIITLTILDATGAPVTATGPDAKINLANVTLAGYAGRLATCLDSEINLTGTLTIDTSARPNNAANTITITAPLAGAGELHLTGGQTALLTSTLNTYTGPTTIETGTLVGNIPDNATLNILANAAYVSGSLLQITTTTTTTVINGTASTTITGTEITPTTYAPKRTLAQLNGAGLLDMSGNDLDIATGDFSTGTLANITTLTKTTTGTLSLAGGTIATLNINEGSLTLGFGQQLTVTGTATIADTGTLNITLGNTAALNAQTLLTNSLTGTAAINITGFGNLTQNALATQTNALITTTDPITRATYTITYQGADIANLPPTEDRFLDLHEDLTNDNAIAITTSLVWNNTTNPAAAHGTFLIPTGTLTIDTPLANNPAITPATPGYHNWDGATLTKKGDGTLVLNAPNTYTGPTNIDAGTLINNNLVTSTLVTIAPTGTLYNNGIITGDITNAGYLLITTNTTPNGVTADIRGNIENTGTLQFNITNANPLNITSTTTDNDDGTQTTITSTTQDPYTYTYHGNLTGPGPITKNGTETLILAGTANTNTGPILITAGTLQSANPHNLDTAASYTIDNQSGTLYFNYYGTGTGIATLDLGGHDQNIKQITYTNNGGILNFGPIATATTPITTYATATIATMTTGTTGRNIIRMRSDYGAAQADKLVITNTVTGAYQVIITNTDTQPANKFTAIPLIVTPHGTGTATTITGTDANGAPINSYITTFTGSAESGIGILMLHTGDEGSTLFPSPDTWYLARTNKLSNTADAIFATTSVSGLEWLYQLDLVRQRMGDLRQETLMRPPSKKISPLAYTTVTSDGGNAWLRANAYHLDATNKITGELFNQDTANIALGLDKTYRWEQHQYLLGAYGNIGYTRRDFDTRGDGKTHNLALGLYFTYLNDNGWYGDTILKLSRDKNSFTANAIDGFINTGEYTAASWGLSIEVGRLKKSRKTGLWYEPSGQIALINFNNAGYTTSNDIHVSIGSGLFQQYRAGLRAGLDKPTIPLKPYARLGLAYTMGSSPTVNIDNMTFAPIIHGFRLEAGAGLSLVINNKSQLYLEYEYAKARDYTRPWSINFGFRHTW